MASQFSNNGKYFAQLSADGKLKVWNALNNTFEQEYVPDFHLTSPCNCLQFHEQASKLVTPRKKMKKRSSQEIQTPSILLGTTSGSLFVYSIAKGELECKIDSGTSQPILCVSSSERDVYTGGDQYIVSWDIEEKFVKTKWKTKEKITAILALPDRNQILTAAKSIKLWDVSTKQTVKSFTGHSYEVILLSYIAPKENSSSYFLCASKGDRLLTCWNLDATSSDTKNAVACFLMEDVCQNISIVEGEDGSTNMAVVTRSGVVHIYKHTLNGKCGKPLKPKTTLQVASDGSQNNSAVIPIPIIGAFLQSNNSLTIGYGNNLLLTFENMTLNEYEKVQCLIRKDPRSSGTSSTAPETQKSRATPVVDETVQYLTPYTSTSTVSTTKRKKGGQEVPMEKRLENLQLNKPESDSKVPRADNVAQLLVQGLHSNDKGILRSVLMNADENVVRNTVKRLPMAVVVPLVEELTNLIKGKTGLGQIGALWMKNLLQIHAGILLANPDLSDLIGPTLDSIETRLTLQAPLTVLRGRLDLLVSQLSSSEKGKDEEDEEALLVFNDKVSSESETDMMDVTGHSDSDNEWFEESENEEVNGENTDEEMSS